MKRLVLVGAGHAHAQVLLEFAQRAIKDLHIVLVSPFGQAPYSGMVPGWLAGHYCWEECCIDFSRLCQRAGAQLITGYAVGIDTQRAQLILADGLRLDYDWLSLNIGSTLQPPDNDGLMVLPMRPLADLYARWHCLLEAVCRLEAGASYRVLMIGGGAAGVESVLAVHCGLTRLAPKVRLHFTLATQGKSIASGMAPGAARRLQERLGAHGIKVVTGFFARHIGHDAVVGENSHALQADAVLWATGAQAHAWPKESGLATDERGFVQVDAMLRSLSHPNIFASGDCAGGDTPLPKAGVYAVRMGPILAHNLLAAMQGEVLQAYIPQRRILVLIGTGGLHAVASWGAFAWQGRWVWRWKQRIDRRFLARYKKADCN